MEIDVVTDRKLFDWSLTGVNLWIQISFRDYWYKRSEVVLPKLIVEGDSNDEKLEMTLQKLL